MVACITYAFGGWDSDWHASSRDMPQTKTVTNRQKCLGHCGCSVSQSFAINPQLNRPPQRPHIPLTLTTTTRRRCTGESNTTHLMFFCAHFNTPFLNGNLVELLQGCAGANLLGNNGRDRSFAFIHSAHVEWNARHRIAPKEAGVPCSVGLYLARPHCPGVRRTFRLGGVGWAQDSGPWPRPSGHHGGRAYATTLIPLHFVHPETAGPAAPPRTKYHPVHSLSLYETPEGPPAVAWSLGCLSQDSRGRRPVGKRITNPFEIRSTTKATATDWVWRRHQLHSSIRGCNQKPAVGCLRT